jgi:hypothetical protein
MLRPSTSHLGIQDVQQQPQAPDPQPQPLSSQFKLVFLAVLVITVLAGIAEIVLAFNWTTPTANQQNVFEAMGFTWKTGTGAILGLLGGKAT